MDVFSMHFKGTTVEELTKKLEEETGILGIFECCCSPLNGKIFPLGIQLPLNIVTMHAIVVPQSSVVLLENSQDNELSWDDELSKDRQKCLQATA